MTRLCRSDDVEISCGSKEESCLSNNLIDGYDSMPWPKTKRPTNKLNNSNASSIESLATSCSYGSHLLLLYHSCHIITKRGQLRTDETIRIASQNNQNRSIKIIGLYELDRVEKETWQRRPHQMIETVHQLFRWKSKSERYFGQSHLLTLREKKDIYGNNGLNSKR